MKNLIGFILSFSLMGSIGHSQSQAPSLSPEQKLTRIRLTLEGRRPDPRDLIRVRNLNGDELLQFLRSKATEYAASPTVVEAMKDNLHQLFRLQYLQAPSTRRLVNYTSIASLFDRLLRNNWSWDQLILAKSYEFDVYAIPNLELSEYFEKRSTGDFQASQDIARWLQRDDVFYENHGERTVIGRQTFPISPSNSSSSYSTYDYSTYGGNVELERQALQPSAAQSQQLAGAITTPRFFDRYTTSVGNRNRGRAAAVLRIFTCNDMQPSVDTMDQHHQNLLMRNALGVDFVPQVPYRQNPSSEARHDSEPACQVCHRILDPLARVFVGSGINLNTQPMAGELVMVRNGQLSRYPVRGFGELGAIIVQQPEYADCQVQHFWNWFVGRNVDLSDTRKMELVQVFNSFGRKPREFIAYLTTTQEFFESAVTGNPSRDSFQISTVRGIFRRCDGCHQKDPLAPGFRLEQWPWIEHARNLHGAPVTSSGVAGDIIHELNLRGDRQRATMPPRESQWQLGPEDLRQITNWLKAGAPDEHGRRQIDEQQILNLRLNRGQ